MLLTNQAIKELSEEVFHRCNVNRAWIAGDYANCSAVDTSTVDFVIDGDTACFSQLKDQLSAIFARKVTVKSVSELTSDDIILQVYSREKISWVGGKVN